MKLMGVTLQHMGTKPNEAEPKTSPEVATDKPKEYFPSLYMNGDQVPDALKSAEHDDVVIIIAKARVVSVGTTDSDGGKRYNVDLELQDVGCKPYSKKKVSEMSEEETIESLKGEEGYDPEDED